MSGTALATMVVSSVGGSDEGETLDIRAEKEEEEEEEEGGGEGRKRRKSILIHTLS